MDSFTPVSWKQCVITFIRWVMIFTISSMEGLWEGSLDQQRVIRLSIGLGRFLIKGGLVPECEKTAKKEIKNHTESDEQIGWHHTWQAKKYCKFMLNPLRLAARSRNDSGRKIQWWKILTMSPGIISVPLVFSSIRLWIRRNCRGCCTGEHAS